jgi:CubicO group peptidase (beta-lactamase class C family)
MEKNRMLAHVRNRLMHTVLGLALAATAGGALAQTPAANPAAPNPAAHELTQADADAWLDGFMPYALEQGDIAGAVVVIVKDGQVLTQRGFGYADMAARKRVDPATTMFRPGSISKLFTWTAVMQLVEQGKIDLDADVNGYLDFKIPPYQGKPVTMREIMTHTAGFQEAIKDLIVLHGPVPPLGEAVKRMLPDRVTAPGSTPAYSNYATSVAGYIVERISGVPFEEYIERHIFEPLGMTHATFRQPLPAQFAPFMSKGYDKASGEAQAYELVAVPPAGSSAVSGADMAKFMIAHLNQGGVLLKPETAQLMHDPTHVTVPGTNRMALGFYEQRINDLSAIAHGGDTEFFHSDLLLVPSRNTGIYISMNSAGADAATLHIRQALFEQFGDRYFPAANDGAPVELPTAKEHAKMLVGDYIGSRGSFTNFLDMLNLAGQLKIRLDKDGRPLIPSLFGDPPRRWIETAPFLWQDAYGHERVGAKVENGRVARWSFDMVSPIMVWDRAPWYRDSGWLMPLFLAALAIVAATALSWPIGAISRRRYDATLALGGGDLKAHRFIRALSWLILAVLGGWLLVIMMNSKLDGGWNWLIWPLEIVGTLSFFALAAMTLWNFRRVRKSARGWFAKLWNGLLVLAALSILWVALAFHLISFGTRF